MLFIFAFKGQPAMYKTVTEHQITFFDFNQSCGMQLEEKNEWVEYYGAAEPPVRGGVSHLSGQTEPPKNHFPSEMDLIP